MRRTSIVALNLALLTALLIAGPVLPAVRFGSDGNDSLVGTTGNDHITGARGNDILKGKAGNDRYYFADDWGTDTLLEKAGEGADTVNFRGVAGGPVAVHVVREWAAVNTFYNRAAKPNSAEVRFAYTMNGQTVESFVENVIGSPNSDTIVGGAGKNVLQPGGGGLDSLKDLGGYDDGPAGMPEVSVSNDVYKGFASNTGTDFIEDWGGGSDVLDLRPFSIDEVYLAPIDSDRDPSGTQESLQIVTSPGSQVVVYGQFGGPPAANFDGQIETIIFADETFTDLSSLQQATATSTEATSGKQAKLAEAADRLAEEARKLLAKAPTPDPLAADRGKADNLQADMGTPRLTQENQPKREKKQNTHQKHHKSR